MKDASARIVRLLQELDLVQDLSSLMYREIMLARLRTVLPFDAACCTTVDPVTLLTTGAITEQGIEAIHGNLLDNEYLQDDYNKFTELAHAPVSARSLWVSTAGQPARSRRYREVLDPAGFGDELRAVLKVGEACWGFLILFRTRENGHFRPEETALINDAGPLIASQLKAKALSRIPGPGPEQPLEEGILVLNEQLVPVSLNPGGKLWLGKLQLMERQTPPALPSPIRAVCLRALAGEKNPASGLPAARLCFHAGDGQFLTLTASRLEGPAGLVQLVVSFTATKASDLLPLITEAFGLTEREKEIVDHLSKGKSTKELAQSLYISPYTVQDHLKSIFAKAGVSSRRELMRKLYSPYNSN
ncbi:CsgBAC operon transcriptional regulatory protein [compost metagenome]